MSEVKTFIEEDIDSNIPDPDETPIRNRRVVTQPYDLAVESLLEQIKNNTIFLRPLSNRPNFQRKYVWTDELASKLIESILLGIPIPPCYLSQNEEFELDVIDGQQRLFSIYRFVNNQFPIVNLEVLTELNGRRFFEINPKSQRQIRTHTMRCILITNESHPEVKFNVFERLNTNTVPLNQQEIRNCMYRGALNNLVTDLVNEELWKKILGTREPDKRMRDEELILRFFAFQIEGIEKYRTPLKFWLNDVARNGMKYSDEKINELRELWKKTISNVLIWFNPKDCFKRPGSRAINKALFDLITFSASKITKEKAKEIRPVFLQKYSDIVNDDNFTVLISRSVDHTKKAKMRFDIWKEKIGAIL